MALFSPADKRTVHFMGIGGAGMSALALIAHRRGIAVTGCDVDPSGAADLQALGVRIVQGHDGSHLAGARAVVVTAAVPPSHPELQRARELNVPIVPRKHALAELIAGAQTVGISGTHGKTTTTVMTTEALTAAGLNPTGIAGGRVSAWGLPSILIPLPTAAADHQSHNARVLAEAGASVLLPQAQLSEGRLGSTIRELLMDGPRRRQIAERALSRGRPDSAREIVYKLLTLIG